MLVYEVGDRVCLESVGRSLPTSWNTIGGPPNVFCEEDSGYSV